MAFFARAWLLMRITLDAEYGIYPPMLRLGIDTVLLVKRN
jgi:hypothetical protein